MSTIFGNKIKTLREEKQIPQRQLAAALEIDTATYCKIEKGDRRAKREQVTVLADLLEVDSKRVNTFVVGRQGLRHYCRRRRSNTNFKCGCRKYCSV
jgi:transcriptional regulator with XRE-family HTH domain